MVQARGGVAQTGGQGGAVPENSALWPPYALSFLRWTETTIALTGGVNTLVAPSSASRVYLKVAIGSTTSVVRAATRAPTLAAGTGQLVQTANPLVITWSTDGPAVNEPWYMIGSIGFTAMVQQAFYEPPADAPAAEEFTDGYDCAV